MLHIGACDHPRNALVPMARLIDNLNPQPSEKFPAAQAPTPRNSPIRPRDHTTWLQTRKTTRLSGILLPVVRSVTPSRALSIRLTFATDKEVRDEALDSLRKYLGAQSEIKELDLLKLWKGLFYCTLDPTPASHDLLRCASLSAQNSTNTIS
jgi:hypothetical protein